jgi:hypothetical protein
MLWMEGKLNDNLSLLPQKSNILRLTMNLHDKTTRFVSAIGIYFQFVISFPLYYTVCTHVSHSYVANTPFLIAFIESHQEC